MKPKAETTSTPASPPPATADSGPTDSGDGGQTTIGIIMTGAGVLGMAVGGVFGLSAKNKWDDAACTDGVCPTQDRQDLAESASTHAGLSTVFFVGGGLLSAVGITLMLTAPSSDEAPATALRLTPSVGPRSTGLWLQGSF